MQVADLFIRFVGDDKAIRKQLEGLETPAGQAGAKAGDKAGNMFATNIRKGLTVAGATGGLVFTEAMSGAVAFEDQLRTIQTVAPDINLDKVGADILDLSKETGKATDDLTAGFYDLVSAGVPADQAIGVLRDSAKFATGALGTTAESVDLVTSALNAYGLDATHSSEVTDIFAKAVADGKVTAAELGSSIANIAPDAAAAGISMEEVSAGYALLTAKGVPAAQAATRMRAAISALLTPNETLIKLQSQTGKNYAELADTKGLHVALEEMRQDFANNGDVIAQLASVSTKDFPAALKSVQKELGLTNSQVEKFSAIAGKDGAAAALEAVIQETGRSEEGFAKALGSVEAYGFALATTGENADDMTDQIAETGDAAGLAQEQYDIASSSIKTAGQRIGATIKATMIQLADPFKEVFGPAIAAMESLGPVMGQVISRGIGAGIGAAAGFVTGPMISLAKNTLAPALASGMKGAGGLITKAVMGFFPALVGVVAPVVSAAGSAIGGFLAAAIPIGMALLPVLIVGAIVAAIIFLINNPEILKAIGDFVGGILKAIGDFLAPIAKTLHDAFMKGVQAVGDAIGGIIDLIGGIVGKVIEVFTGIVRAYVEFWFNLYKTAFEVIANIVGLFLSIPGRIAEFVAGVINQVVTLAGQIISTVTGFIGQVVGFFLGLPGRIVQGWVNILTQVAQLGANIIAKVIAFIGQVVGFFLGIPGRIASLIGSIAGVAANAIAGFLGNVVRGVGTVVSTMLSIPGKLVGLIGEFGNIAAKMVEKFLGFIGEIPGKVGDILGGVGDFVGGLIPKFATGAYNIPQDMLAIVHKGEMIIPANEAAAIRSGRGLAPAPVEAGGGGGPLTVNVYNPTPEPASTSTKRELQKVALFGGAPA